MTNPACENCIGEGFKDGHALTLQDGIWYHGAWKQVKGGWRLDTYSLQCSWCKCKEPKLYMGKYKNRIARELAEAEKRKEPV